MSRFTKGDIVLVDLSPSEGHELKDPHPVLVMNRFPLPGGLNIIVPITTKNKSFPMQVELDERTTTKGIVMCFQIRTLDLLKRNGRFLEHAPSDIVDKCQNYITRLIS